MKRPSCYKCKNRGEVPGSAHSNCVAVTAKVAGSDYGIKSGWFFWPINFDPVWLESCDSFKVKDDEA